jgi:hypothetical protein
MTSFVPPQIEHLLFAAGDTNWQSIQSIASRKGTYAGRLVSRPNFIGSLATVDFFTANLLNAILLPRLGGEGTLFLKDF